MMRKQYPIDKDIVFRFEPVHGCPDGNAVTVTLYNAENQEIDTGAASLSGGTATVAADAAYRLDQVRVGSGEAAALKVRQTYRLKNPSEEETLIRIRGKGADVSDDFVDLDQPLVIDVKAGATLTPIQYTYTLLAAQNTTTIRRARARIEYVVDAEPFVEDFRFDIVKEPFNPVITESMIEKEVHEFGELAGRGRWRTLIPGAIEEVSRVLRMSHLEPDLVRDRDGLKVAVIYALLMKMRRSTPDAEQAEKDFDRVMNQVLVGNTHYDRDDNQIASDSAMGENELVVPARFIPVA